MENSDFQYDIIQQKLAISNNEYYCTTITDSFFPIFPSLNYHL